MRTLPSSLPAALAAFALAGACARTPQPAAPAPQSAPQLAPTAAAAPAAPAPAAPAAAQSAAVDLAGDWSFVADFPGQRMVGVIQLRRSGTSWVGSATPEGADGSATLLSLTFDGSRVVMLFDTPDGEARAVAVLADPRTMNGTVSMAGHTSPFTARKL